MNKIEALSKHTSIEPESIEQSIYDDCAFEIGTQLYLVLTNEEADERAIEYCTNSLWAFNASFLVNYIANDDTDALIESIQIMQEKMCESCNATIKAMLGNELDNMIDDAISADGRGHFLSPYDGEEIEVGQYFIYRIN